MILVDLNDFSCVSYIIALGIATVIGTILSIIFLFFSLEIASDADEEAKKQYFRAASVVWIVTSLLIIANVVFPTKHVYIYDTITKKYVTEENIDYMMKLHNSTKEDAIKAIYDNVQDQLIEVGIMAKNK